MKNLFIYYLIYIWDRCNAFGVMNLGGQNRCNENRCNENRCNENRCNENRWEQKETAIINCCLC